MLYGLCDDLNLFVVIVLDGIVMVICICFEMG